MLRAFADAAGPEKPLPGVSRADCEALLKGFQERGCRPNTRKAYHRVLDAFFRWLVAEERLPETPMRRVPKPELPQEQVKPLTPEELARLLAQRPRVSMKGPSTSWFCSNSISDTRRVGTAARRHFSAPTGVFSIGSTCATGPPK